MSAAVLPAQVTPDDRLGLTVCVAILIHAMIVLGVSFAPEPRAPSRFESLEVILVPEHSPQAPEHADVLAQANLEGGGNSDEDVRPSAPIKAPLPAPTAAITVTPSVPLEPMPAREVAQPPPAPLAHGRATVAEKLTAPAPRATLAIPKQQDSRPTKDKSEQPVAVQPPPQPETESEPLPTATQLLTRSFTLASVSAELQQRLDNRAKRPRRKYISANTKEYRYAAYMEAWRAKVERIGNINYPDEARSRQLSGSLLLDVALRPDGSVTEITIRHSSGQPVLDDAAVRIVELAAPFAPFPPDIRREIDVLHVTRTWKFLNTEGFSSSP